MVSRDHLDNLEQEFRSRFEEPPYDIPQDWNTPSDAVWENISAQIDTKKKKRRYYWFLLLLLPLGLFVGKQFFYPSNQNANQTNNQSENSNKSEQINSQDYSNVESTFSNTDSLAKQSQQKQSVSYSSKDADKFSAQRATKKINRQLFGQPTLNSAATQSSFWNSRNKEMDYNTSLMIDNKATTPISNSQLSYNFRYTPAKENNPSKSLTQTTSVGRLDGITPSIILVNQPIFSLSKRENKNVLEEKAKKKVGYGLLAGAFTPNASVSKEYNDLLTPFDFYYENELSYQFGGFVSVPISNKIELESGLNYRSQRLKTGHNSNIVYDQTAEDVVGDIAFTAYNSSFATSFGVVDANMVLARNQNVAVNNEEFTVDINMNQRINQVSLPIKPKITVFGNQSIDVKVNPALNFNYIVSQNTFVENIETNTTKITDHNSKITGSLGQLNDFTTDQSLSIELVKKQFFGKTDLSIEPYYTINSGKIFEQNSFSSKTRAAGVNLKLRLK